MGEACLKFDTPVTGGNVSFYNQSPEGPVYPTPTIGMVGLLDSINQKMTMYFKSSEDSIYVVGHLKDDFNSSEYLHKIHSIEYSPAPYFNLDEEFQMQQLVTSLIKNNIISSAHDVSEGGLIVTLLESSFFNNLGFEVNAASGNIRKDAFWFGETQGRVVISVNPSQNKEFLDFMSTQEVPYHFLGQVSESTILIGEEDWGTIDEWKSLYDNAIELLLKK
jgi:phosphoribosylformylglycinamidine synthase